MYFIIYTKIFGVLISFAIVCGRDAFDCWISLSVYSILAHSLNVSHSEKLLRESSNGWNFRTFIVSCFACDKCDVLLEYAYPAYALVSMCVYWWVCVGVWNIHIESVTALPVSMYCLIVANTRYSPLLHRPILTLVASAIWISSCKTFSAYCYIYLLLLLLIRCLYCACAWFFFSFCSYCYVTCIWEIRKRKSHTVRVFSRLFSAH